MYTSNSQTTHPTVYSILAPFEDIFLTKAAEGGERPCSRASGKAAIILGITVKVASSD